MHTSANARHFSPLLPAPAHSTPRSRLFPPPSYSSRAPPPSSSLLLGPCSRQSPIWRCHGISKPTRRQGFTFDLFKEKTTTPVEEESVEAVVVVEDEDDGLRKRIGQIKAMLSAMGDGEISISAYDTAWVALVEDIHGGGGGGPQFPSSLQWIIDNQLPDGSWGDRDFYTAHDRLICTLACAIALKKWDICHEQCTRGMEFLRENMHKLADEDEEHMTIGFEIVFPSLLDIARTMDLDVPYDTPALQDIYAMRRLKLERIPKDLVHKVPTTVLHSLEGMAGLDWERLLRLQCSDGSMLFSPASTAFALMQTKDDKCLQYLDKIVARFNGGVPNVYPIDLFEHIWAVDRLERLGISRYFEMEIKDCIDYVYRYWTDDGICWARNSTVHDVDDTAMTFRLLRLHGYDVSSEVFRNFQKEEEFFCFAGQSNQAVTGIYNLNRASQVQFPGEKVLEEARSFSYRFLREKQQQHQLLDKWIITKDLPGEVEYALDLPWYASLPRVEARIYVEQYGGDNDVWIGKTLYRMPYVNNNVYLDLAKADFNRCQAVHQEEWLALQRWFEECGLGDCEHGLSKDRLLEVYFLAACSIFEPERSVERMGWGRSAALIQAVASHLRSDTCTGEMREGFIQEFCDWNKNHDARNGLTKKKKTTREGLVSAIHYTIHNISVESAARTGTETRQGGSNVGICHGLRQAWKDWLVTIGVGDGDDGGSLLLARTLELCVGRTALEESLFSSSSSTSSALYSRLANLTSSVCARLNRHRASYPQMGEEDKRIDPVELDMQELVQRLFKNSSGVDNNTKKTFLAIAKTFYYVAHCPPSTINHHISKVLFQRVV